MTLTSLHLRNDVPHNAPGETFSDAFARQSIKELLSDEDLLRKLQQGDENACAELYDRHAAVTCGVALRIVRDQGAAEEVVEAVFLMLWRHAETLPRTASVAGWLALTARQLALALLEGRPQPAAQAPSPWEPGAMVIEPFMQRAREALRSMTPGKRKALEIAFFDGLAPEEIVTFTGETAESIRAGLRASLLVLRRAVQL